MKFFVVALCIVHLAITSLAQVASREIKKGDLQKAIAEADKKVAKAWERNTQAVRPWADEYIYYDIYEAAKTYFYCSEFQKASSLFDWCLKVVKRKNTSRTDLNQLFLLISETNVELGNYAKAELFVDEIVKKTDLDYFTVTEESEAGVKFDAVVNIYQQIGRFDKVEKLFTNSLQVFFDNINSKKISKVVITPGQYSDTRIYLEAEYRVSRALQFYIETAQFGKAERLLDSFEKIHAQKVGTDTYLSITLLDRKADLLIAMGQYEKALDMCQRMEELANKFNKANNVNYSWINYRFGKVYLKLNKFQDAEFYFHKSLDITDQKGSRRAEVSSLFASMGLSSAMNAQKKYASALTVAKEAIQKLQKNSIWLNRFGNQRVERYCLNELNQSVARSFQGLTRYDSAEYYFNLALENQKGSPFEMAATKKSLAVMYRQAGQSNKATKHFKESIDTLLHFWSANQISFSERERSDFLVTISNVISEFNNYVIDEHPTNPELLRYLMNVQLNTKGTLLSTSKLIRDRVYRSRDTSLVNTYSRWLQKKDYFRHALQRPAKDLQNNGINVSLLEQEVEKLEKVIAKKVNVERDLVSLNNFRTTDLQQRLTDGEAVVEVVRIAEIATNRVRYAFLILEPESDVPKLVLIENGDDLEKRHIKFYRNAIAAKLIDNNSYNHFWDPVAKALQGVQKIYLCPDGVYNLININTLLNPAQNTYVQETARITQVLSLKDIHYVSKLPPTSLALFGSPTYRLAPQGNAADTSILDSETDSIRSIFGGQIPSLPGTLKEVNTISGYLKSAQITHKVFIEKEATEAAIKAINGVDVLHIATHGYFLEDQDINDQFTFIGYDNTALIKNPLLRSGLLFAGSQQSFDGLIDVAEDGILTSDEALSLNLKGTRLVVLSACETGLGKIKNGEGVYGLQRAFTKAGADAVLMSLWKVDDDATQRLISSFYKNWIQTGDKHEAFRIAQGELRKTFAHPYFWGAFVLTGK